MGLKPRKSPDPGPAYDAELPCDGGCNRPVGGAYYSDVEGYGNLCIGCHIRLVPDEHEGGGGKSVMDGDGGQCKQALDAIWSEVTEPDREPWQNAAQVFVAVTAKLDALRNEMVAERKAYAFMECDRIPENCQCDGCQYAAQVVKDQEKDGEPCQAAPG